MDLTLYKNQLEKILKDVDKEIDVQFGKSDETKINLSNVKSILGRIDNQIVNRAQIAKGMAGDKETREEIKQMINETNIEIKKRLDRFKESLSNDEKKEEIGGIYKDVVQNNETNRTQRQLDQFEEETEKENGKYDLGDVDKRLRDAEVEFQATKKVFERKEEYEKIKKSSKKDDKILQNEFTGLKKEAQVWADSLKKLEKIKQYDYVKNINELIDSANAGIDVNDDLKSKFKDLRNHLHLLMTDDSVAKALDGIDLEKVDITEIRNVLESLNAMNIGEMEEIKDNEVSAEAVTENFIQEIDNSDILKLFAQDKKRIKADIKDDSKSLSEKWDNIQNFFKNNGKVVKDVSTKTEEQAKLEMYEIYHKIDRLKQEKDRNEQIQELGEQIPEVPLDVDSTVLDLSELGLDQNTRFQYEGENNPCDFSLVGEDDLEYIVDNLYEELSENEEAMNTAKDYLRENDNLPVVRKPFQRIRAIFCKLFRKPTAEEKQWEASIKSELKRRVLEVSDLKAESDVEHEKYHEATTAFNEQVALKKEEMEEFRKAEREVIIKGRGKTKAKDVVKEAEKRIDKEFYK